MRAFKKFVTYTMVFFIPFSFAKLFNFILSLLLLYSLKVTNYREERRFFVYMTASVYHYTSKEVETAF